MTQLLVYTNELGLVAISGKPDLKTLQERVGGYVELVTMPGSIDAYCDEEGTLKNLDPSIAVRHRAGHTVYLRGPVVFVVRRSTSPGDSIARVQQNATPLRLSPRRVIAPQPSTVQ